MRDTTLGVSSEGVALAILGSEKEEIPPMIVATLAKDSRRDTVGVSK